MSARDDLELEVVLAAQDGNKKAMEKVLARMEPIVASLAWKAGHGSHHQVEELIQAGQLGVLEALQSFDPEKGSFMSWAWGPIRTAMAEARTQGMSGPSIPRPRLWIYYDALEKTDGDVDAAMDLCSSEGTISRSSFRAIHDSVTGTVSPYSFTGPGEVEARFEVEDTEDLAEDVAMKVTAEAFLDLLEDPGLREIVVLYFGLDGRDPMDDVQISKLLDVPRRTVAWRRLKALKIMREGV